MTFSTSVRTMAHPARPPNASGFSVALPPLPGITAGVALSRRLLASLVSQT